MFQKKKKKEGEQSTASSLLLPSAFILDNTFIIKESEFITFLHKLAYQNLNLWQSWKQEIKFLKLLFGSIDVAP